MTQSTRVKCTVMLVLLALSLLLSGCGGKTFAQMYQSLQADQPDLAQKLKGSASDSEFGAFLKKMDELAAERQPSTTEQYLDILSEVLSLHPEMQQPLKEAFESQVASQVADVVIAQASAVPKIRVGLTDIAGHWAEELITQLVLLGAATGYPDSTFRPDGSVSRAEFVVMLVKAFDKPLNPEGSTFSDTESHWARVYIKSASEHGFATGYSDGTFRPDERITREQMAFMLFNAAGLKVPESSPTFKDATDIAPWATQAVSAAAASGVISGYPDGTFQPAGNLSRAEAAAVLVRALGLGQ